jgi:hypothetical protein
LCHSWCMQGFRLSRVIPRLESIVVKHETNAAGNAISHQQKICDSCCPFGLIELRVRRVFRRQRRLSRHLSGLAKRTGLMLLVLTSFGCRRAEKETVAASSILQLREMFDKGECSSVYAGADPAFRSQSEENWVRQCEQLRHDLGSWQSFQKNGAEQELADPRFRLVSGEAVFANGTYHLEMYWNVSVAPARLCYFQLGTNPNIITVPPFKRNGPNDAPIFPPKGWSKPPSLQRAPPRNSSVITFG